MHQGLRVGRVDIVAWHHQEGHERVVELVGVANNWLGVLFGHLDRARIYRAQIAFSEIETPRQADRSRAAFFQGRIVEKSVGIGIDQLVAQGRRLAGLLCDGDDGAAFDLRQERLETVDVHELFETIAHGLVDQRVPGDFDLAYDIF